MAFSNLERLIYQNTQTNDVTVQHIRHYTPMTPSIIILYKLFVLDTNT